MTARRARRAVELRRRLARAVCVELGVPVCVELGVSACVRLCVPVCVELDGAAGWRAQLDGAARAGGGALLPGGMGG